jgi:hypothetical protein
LSQIIMSGLSLGTVLSVRTCWFHSMVTFPPWIVSTDFGTCLYQCFLSNCTSVSCICWSVVVHSLYHAVLYSVPGGMCQTSGYVKVYRYNPKHLYQSWTVTVIMAREKCGLLAVPRTLPVKLTRFPYTAHVLESGMQCNSILLDIHVPCKVFGTLRTTTALVRVFM